MQFSQRSCDNEERSVCDDHSAQQIPGALLHEMAHGTSGLKERREYNVRSSTHTERSAIRREGLVASARALFEEKGLARTSVKNITEAAGVTRSLFYHYFADKHEITQAVLDSYVDDFLESARIWDENCDPGDIEGSLRDCIRMIRRCIFDSNPFRRDLVSSENAGLYLDFVHRCTASLAEYVTTHTVVDYAKYHRIEIEHVSEMSYVLIAGLIAYMRRHPDASEDMLMDLVAQILHLEGWKMASERAALKVL